MISGKCISCKHRIDGDEIVYDDFCLNPGRGIPCALWTCREFLPYELEMITIYRMIRDGQKEQAMAFIEQLFSKMGVPKGAIQ